MTELLQEMAESGPSSVLDLAEQVNDKQSRFSFPVPESPSDTPSPDTGPSSLDEETTSRFAAVLERIAKESGLVPDATEPAEVGTGKDFTAAGACEPQAETQPSPALVTEPTAPHQLTDLGVALHDMGLPLAPCYSVMPAVDRDSLREELALVLKEYLPALPPLPTSASSVVAVVGPWGQVMRMARALALEMGVGADEIAVATTQSVWGRQGNLIDNPTTAREQRRSWRWRKGPAVVAIEQEVRPRGNDWALEVLQALEPTLAWGVAPAAYKSEDIAAWSGSLGGLDAICLVDLEATTTPAAALSAVAVSRLDGTPATAEQWADVLCRRLLG